ncbi:PHP domain-containing protein [Halorubrum sp. CBA1125]|uniref:PHP domain-containing protein n=1 Tax=Halorubrum sp. CBA1125 TaxID=2668072 RepID=UPI0018D23B90
MIADLHVHTEHSHDSWATVENVLDTAEQRGLEAIAITDTIRSRAQRMPVNWLMIAISRSFRVSNEPYL